MKDLTLVSVISQSLYVAENLIINDEKFKFTPDELEGCNGITNFIFYITNTNELAAYIRVVDGEVYSEAEAYGFEEFTVTIDEVCVNSDFKGRGLGIKLLEEAVMLFRTKCICFSQYTLEGCLAIQPIVGLLAKKHSAKILHFPGAFWAIGHEDTRFDEKTFNMLIDEDNNGIYSPGVWDGEPEMFDFTTV